MKYDRYDDDARAFGRPLAYFMSMIARARTIMPPTSSDCELTLHRRSVGRGGPTGDGASR